MSRLKTVTVTPEEWRGAERAGFRKKTLDSARQTARTEWACVRIVEKSRFGKDLIATIDYRFWTYEKEEAEHERIEKLLQAETDRIIEEMRLQNTAEEDVKRAARRERFRALRKKMRVPDFIVE